MLMNLANVILAAGIDTGSCAATTADATAAGAQGGLLGGMSSMLLPLAMIIILIVVMIVPQRRRDKKVKEMLNALKPGDRVRTIGGIYGTISSVKDDVVVLTVGPDKVKLVFARGAISQVEETGVENTMTEDVHE
ncbi:MAG: preprotein translocase subunit YajC [Clostridia bacterium]|nr:preprotein translocase subunit YajC [Clostridia bacterium]